MSWEDEDWEEEPPEPWRLKPERPELDHDFDPKRAGPEYKLPQPEDDLHQCRARVPWKFATGPELIVCCERAAGHQGMHAARGMRDLIEWD